MPSASRMWCTRSPQLPVICVRVGTVEPCTSFRQPTTKRWALTTSSAGTRSPWWQPPPPPARPQPPPPVLRTSPPCWPWRGGALRPHWAHTVAPVPRPLMHRRQCGPEGESCWHRAPLRVLRALQQRGVMPLPSVQTRNGGRKEGVRRL